MWWSLEFKELGSTTHIWYDSGTFTPECDWWDPETEVVNREFTGLNDQIRYVVILTIKSDENCNGEYDIPDFTDTESVYHYP